MTLDTFTLIDHGTELLDWRTDTPEGQERMAADLKLLAELLAMILADGDDRHQSIRSQAAPRPSLPCWQHRRQRSG